VDGSGTGYLKTVCDYVHLNPVRAGLVSPEQRLEEYRWSSYPSYLREADGRPRWLCVARLLGEWRIPQDSPAGREHFALELESRRQAETEDEFKPVRRGWCLGSEQFREELLAQVSEQKGSWHFGPELQESAQDQAERLIGDELKREGLSEQELKERRKGDPLKVSLAMKLRAETTVTVEWIAARLEMGTRGHLTHLLYWHKRRLTEQSPVLAQQHYGNTID
jgi:hypothetical protein